MIEISGIEILKTKRNITRNLITLFTLNLSSLIKCSFKKAEKIFRYFKTKIFFKSVINYYNLNKYLEY